MIIWLDSKINWNQVLINISKYLGEGRGGSIYDPHYELQEFVHNPPQIDCFHHLIYWLIGAYWVLVHTFERICAISMIFCFGPYMPCPTLIRVTNLGVGGVSYKLYRRHTTVTNHGFPAWRMNLNWCFCKLINFQLKTLGRKIS